MKNPTIVFNCSYNGLSILQELGSKGIECIAMDCVRGIGTFTKYATYKKCPDPLRHESLFIEYLYSFCKRYPNKPVLIPTNDEWAYAISKYKQYLEEVSYPCVSEFDVVNLCINKNQFYRIGQKNKYLTPKLWNVNDIDNIEFPIIAKPVYRAISSDNGNPQINKFLNRNRMTVIDNKNEMQEFIKHAGKYIDYFLFQEYVRGYSDSMFTVGLYADRKSEIKALFTGKKVRGYPADIGDNIVGESRSVPDILIENTRRIVFELKYSGIAEFEYKKNSVTGEFRLIEINPRAWSWIGVTPSCGVNIPLIAYEEMCGVAQDESPVQSEESIRYVKLYQDALNCLIRYRFSHPAWSMPVKKWWDELKAHKNIYAELNKRDHLVSLASIVYVMAKLVTRQ
jgi:D-aspartate ligase